MNNDLAIIGVAGSTIIAIGSLVFSAYIWNKDAAAGMICFLWSLLIIIVCLCAITDLCS